MIKSLSLASFLLLVSIPCYALTVDPNPIQVHTFFHGTTVLVRGSIEAGTSIFVTITGSTIEEKFNQKGRIGPLWANVGKFKVTGVPRLHLIATTAPLAVGTEPGRKTGPLAVGTEPGRKTGPLEKSISRMLIDQHLLDLDSLGHKAKIEPMGPDADRVRREYIKLKQSQKVFALFENNVHLNGTSFEASIPWPDSAPTGKYQVNVYHVREGKIARIETQDLNVELIGVPRFIAHMAFERSALYGLLSVIIALSVGFIMGLVFKKKGSGGH